MRICTDSTERIGRRPLTAPSRSAKRSVGTAACSTARRRAPRSQLGGAVGDACVTALRGRQVRHPRVDRLALPGVDPVERSAVDPAVGLVARHLS